jgi:shikimate dehydrogenase
MSGRVYQLEDLASRAGLDADATKPALLAVIGCPVAHSASPAMHQPALDACGIHGRYIRLEVPIGRVTEALQQMKALGFVGANVTVPHKFAALDACHHVDDAAREMGAVNTVKFSDGETLGYNTDGPGFAKAIEEEFGTELAGLRVMIVGAGGGAGQAIATQCARAGAQRVILVNRTIDKIQALGQRLARRFSDTQFHALAIDDVQLASVAKQCQLLVNTSSLGLKADDPSPIEEQCFAAHHWVYDTIYQPPRTAFLRQAEAAGARVANGFSMLLHQGVFAFDHWYPGKAPLEIMRAGLRSVS